MFKCFLTPTLLLLETAVLLSAQTASSPPQTRPMMGKMSFSGTAQAGPVLKGKPYSAKQTTEHTQTLADGTHITTKPTTTLLYRDSEGRTRTERPFFGGPYAPNVDGPIVIQISDSVAGYQYTLDPENHIAHRVKMTPFPRSNGTGGVMAGVVAAPPPPPPAPRISTLPATASAANGPVQHTDPDGRTITTENLGTQSIEGVVAQGYRTTTTIPAGLEGNDAPITTVNETWFSQQIAMVVLSKNTDPRNGENTTKVTNIVLGDPDPTQPSFSHRQDMRLWMKQVRFESNSLTRQRRANSPDWRDEDAVACAIEFHQDRRVEEER